jgi:hypothetical protein
MNGIKDIRLRIQCANNLDHAKIIRIDSFLRSAPDQSEWVPCESSDADRVLKVYFARRIGEVICGQSELYIYKPGDRSPIGRCVLCNGILSFEIQEWDGGGYGAQEETGGSDGRAQIR